MDGNGSGDMLGPMCRAYEKILETDSTPRESLNRLGISRDDFFEVKPLLEFIRIKHTLQENRRSYLELDLLVTGFLIGLQLAEERKHGA